MARARRPSSILRLPSSSTTLRGTRPRNRGRSHKPVQMGVTPIPATNFGKCPGYPALTWASSNMPEATTGVFPALPTIWTRSSIKESDPLSAGRLRVQLPSSPPSPTMDPGDQGVREPSLQNKSPAFRESPGRPARGVAATFLAWNQGTAGAIPAAQTSFCQMVSK